LRIDKYLWCVRLAKTRSLASDLIAKGKVKLNGAPVKSSREVKEGDVIQLIKNSAVFSYKIIGVLRQRIGAPSVKDFIVDITDPEEIEKFKLYQQSQNVYRHHGDGKPTKKDRRSIDDFLDNWD
jgi:ribosome-associated heat shock protein Hsp15